MVASINGSTPKCLVYNGKSYETGLFGGSPIFGNLHMGNRHKNHQKCGDGFATHEKSCLNGDAGDVKNGIGFTSFSWVNRCSSPKASWDLTHPESEQRAVEPNGYV
jgi:hypothetical protein